MSPRSPKSWPHSRRARRGAALAVIYVAGGDHHREQLPPVVDHQVDFEAGEPAGAGLAPLGQLAEDLVRLDPQVVADLDRSRINERNARARAKSGVQESRQRQDELALRLDEPPGADQIRELSPQMLADLPRGGGLE